MPPKKSEESDRDSEAGSDVSPVAETTKEAPPPPEKKFDFIPDSVDYFLGKLKDAIGSRNVPEIHKLYEDEYNKIKIEHYKSRRWPSADSVAEKVSSEPLFLLLYKELYYRHVYVELQVSFDDRKGSWDNYCKLLDLIISDLQENDKPVALPAVWICDILDEFVYHYQTYCTTRSKATCECIREMPTLLFEPVVALIIKVPLIGGLAFGGLHLITCVAEVHHPVRSWADNPFVTVEYSPDLPVYLVIYALIALWMMEFTSALSQFAISYSTQLWWFSHYRPTSGAPTHSPSFATCGGMCVGICYHVGTLAYGSFLIPLARIPRVLLRGIASASQNPVVAPCVACCRCCTSCHTRFLRFLTKNAYMDVAVNGSDFCQAAHQAHLVLQNEATAAAVLNGATWLFQVTGLAAISFAGAFITYIQVTGVVAFADYSSPDYAEDPIFLVAVSFVLCFLVTLPFMLVFDHVSDSILYCFASGCTKTAQPNANGFTAMPPLGRGGKVDCHGPETQALLNRAGLSRPTGGPVR